MSLKASLKIIFTLITHTTMKDEERWDYVAIFLFCTWFIAASLCAKMKKLFMERLRVAVLEWEGHFFCMCFQMLKITICSVCVWRKRKWLKHFVMWLIYYRGYLCGNISQRFVRMILRKSHQLHLSKVMCINLSIFINNINFLVKI